MTLVDQTSLAQTLDNVNEALFYGRPQPAASRSEAAGWLASRQGLPGAYAGVFAPVEDYRTGSRLGLFTGELRSSRGGAAHILGEETCRALALLDVRLPEVRQALERAREGMFARLGEHTENAWYCCCTCSAALWRHLAVCEPSRRDEWLSVAVRTLSGRRDAAGRWRGFPFHYTLLALTEMPPEISRAELRHAAPVCERALTRAPGPGKYGPRRHELMRRALERC
jgi:hypothetical protein